MQMSCCNKTPRIHFKAYLICDLSLCIRGNVFFIAILLHSGKKWGARKKCASDTNPEHLLLSLYLKWENNSPVRIWVHVPSLLLELQLFLNLFVEAQGSLLII